MQSLILNMHTLYLQDTTVITKDFPKALTGIVHLFPARPACRLVVPEEFVFREALDETRRPLARGNDPSNPVTVVPQFGMTRRAKRKRILDVQGVIGYSNSNRKCLKYYD